MTKCNWKLGLYLWAAAIFAVLPICAKSALAASNKAVQAEVEAYNRKSIVTDEEKKQLEQELKEAKDKCGLSFKNTKLWAKVQKFQKTKVSWYALTAEKHTSDLFSNYLSTLGNYYDNLWENIESIQPWSGFLNTMKDIERQINYYHDDAVKNANGDIKALEKINKEYDDIMAEYKELYKATDETRQACETLNSFDKKAMKSLREGTLFKSIYCPKEEEAKGKDKDYSKCQTILYTYSDDGVAKTLKGNTRGCIPLPMKLNESRSCIFCPLFKTIFSAAQKMATLSYAALAVAIANVLLVGLALWIAFSIMVKVSSFTKMDTPKFITELLTQIFKVMVAYLLLMNASFVYSTVIGPLLKAGMEFGMSLLFEKGSEYLNACESISTDRFSGGLLPSYLYSQLECFIQAVQAELAIPQSIGSSLMCVARHAASEDLGAVTKITNVRMPDFSMMFQGLIIWVFAWLVSLAFAFYLIDAVVRLGIIGALMPFLIASWPFKVTSKYTAQGWSMFMNTFFTFVFMGLVVSVNVQLMGHALGGAGGYDTIMAAINGSQISLLTDLLDIGFAGFLILIASCIFGFKLTSQATELAGSMAGGGGSSPIGANIGGLAASAAKAGVQGTGKVTWGATKIVGNATGVTPKLRQAKDATKAWVGRKLGFGSNSGVAGGKPSRTTSNRPVTPTTQTQPNPNTPFSIDGNKQQADAVQNADPRNQNTPITPTNSGRKPTPTHSDQTQPQTPEQLKQQLENDYNNTANGKAGQQMILNQAAEVTRNKKTENEAQNKMNYHNKRADEYLKKAGNAPDPVQKKQFEDLANAQFAEAVKAEAEYNKAKAETLKSEAELQAVRQENERYKNQYVQDEMKKRNPVK